MSTPSLLLAPFAFFSIHVDVESWTKGDQGPPPLHSNLLSAAALFETEILFTHSSIFFCCFFWSGVKVANHLDYEIGEGGRGGNVVFLTTVGIGTSYCILD